MQPVTAILVIPTLLTFLLAIPILIYRLIWLLPHQPSPSPSLRKAGTPTHLLIVLGSGGHTAEMLAMLRALNPTRITHRSYVVSSGDAFSARKAREFEASLADRWGSKQTNGKVAHVGEACFTIHTVPRARRIYQPLYTTPWTCALCFVGCVRAMCASPRAGHAHARGKGEGNGKGEDTARRPDLILTNGPATAVVVVFAALALKFVGLARRDEMRTLYVESFARVKKLSLSGRILLPVVDRFLVQWEALKSRVGDKAEFRGVLVG